MADNIRVLIVDDSVVMRALISKALDSDPDLDVVGVAANGSIALQKITKLKPDLVVLDIAMPVMDGIETLQEIKKMLPRLPVIMFSAVTREGSKRTIQALELGAEDCVAKPDGSHDPELGVTVIRDSLATKIKALCRHKGAAPSIVAEKPRVIPRFPQPARRANQRPIELVAVGVSTGGPNALAELMPTFPVDFPVPIVIVQHMPPVFTHSLATRLDSLSAIEVKEAEAGDELKAGHAYLAPGGFHMVLERTFGYVRIALNKDAPVEGCRPAVNVLFRSAAYLYGSQTIAVILTGMGKDGMEGSTKIVEAGGRLLAQDEASSVVWGMPGAVARAGLPEQILPLTEIGPEIVKSVLESMPNYSYKA